MARIVLRDVNDSFLEVDLSESISSGRLNLSMDRARLQKEAQAIKSERSKY